MPEGLRDGDSWIEANFDRYFRLMEADDVTVFRQWILRWRDLIDLEAVPVNLV